MSRFTGRPPPINASSPRDPLSTARFNCGDPISSGRYLAQDQSASNEFPQIEPSIPCDHLEPSGVMRDLDRRIASQDAELSKIDLLLAIIYRLLPRDKRGEVCGVSLDSLKTDNGARAMVKKDGCHYDVMPKPAQGGS